MNYKIKIAGIITLISVFLLAVIACEDAEVVPTTYNYICVNGTADTGSTTTEGEQRCISCNVGFTFDSISATCTGGFTCQNGTPTSGPSPIPGALSCEECDDLYTLTNNNLCEPAIQFICPNGIPVGGPAPAAGIINCQSCNSSTHTLINSACTTRSIRLRGGSNELEGRVEIFHNGQWGTVCDDLWDDTNAAVACRSLGFSSMNAMFRSSAGFGAGTGQIWLDNVNCTGTEARLIDCPANSPGSHNCNHNEDVGVVCQP